MNKNNVLVPVLIIILVVSMAAAINFLIKKYEKESVPQAAKNIAPALIKPQEVKPEPAKDLSQEEDNQFPTEKGRFLQ